MNVFCSYAFMFAIINFVPDIIKSTLFFCTAFGPCVTQSKVNEFYANWIIVVVGCLVDGRRIINFIKFFRIEMKLNWIHLNSKTGKCIRILECKNSFARIDNETKWWTWREIVCASLTGKNLVRHCPRRGIEQQTIQKKKKAKKCFTKKKTGNNAILWKTSKIKILKIKFSGYWL